MRINEASLGPVYLASDDSIQKWFWPHVAAIHEMCEPYRRGRAVILPTGKLRFLALGIWTRSFEEDIDVDFPNDWADWMQSWDTDFDNESPEWISGGGKLKPRVKDEVEKEADASGVEEPECGGTL